MSYLERSNSDENDREKASKTVIFCSLVDKVNDFMKELDSAIICGTMSEASCFEDWASHHSGVKRSQAKDFQDDKFYRSERSGHSFRGSSHGFSMS